MAEPTFKRYKMKNGTEEVWGQLENGEWIKAVDYYRKQIAEDESPLSAAGIAFDRSVTRTLDGIQELLGFKEAAPESEKAAYDALKEAHPGATFGGEMGGDMAQIIAGGGAISKIPAVANLAKSSPVLANTLADLTAASAIGGARTPEGDASRLENATTEALWSLGGGVLDKAATGVQLSKAGKEAMERGEYLTPSYATDNHILAGLEAAMEVTPVTAYPTKQLRAEAQDAWRRGGINDIAKQLDIDVSDAANSRVAYDNISNTLNDRYAAAFRDIDSLPESVFKSIYQTAPRYSANLLPRDREILQDTLKTIRKMQKETTKKSGRADMSELADRVDFLLRQRAGQAQGPLREALIELKKSYHRALGGSVASELSRLDKVFPESLVLRDAVRSANRAGTAGEFSPGQILSASDITSTADDFAAGRGALQEFGDRGAATVGKNEGGAPLEWFRRLAGATPGAPNSVMKTLGNIITGTTVPHLEAKDLPVGILKNLSASKALPASAQYEEEEDPILKLIRALGGS